MAYNAHMSFALIYLAGSEQYLLGKFACDMDFDQFSDDPFVDFAGILAQSESKLNRKSQSTLIRPKTASLRAWRPKEPGANFQSSVSVGRFDVAPGGSFEKSDARSRRENKDGDEEEEEEEEDRGTAKTSVKIQNGYGFFTQKGPSDLLFQPKASSGLHLDQERKLKVGVLREESVDPEQRGGIDKLETLSEVSERLSVDWIDPEESKESENEKPSGQKMDLRPETSTSHDEDESELLRTTGYHIRGIEDVEEDEDADEEEEVDDDDEHDEDGAEKDESEMGKSNDHDGLVSSPMLNTASNSTGSKKSDSGPNPEAKNLHASIGSDPANMVDAAGIRGTQAIGSRYSSADDLARGLDRSDSSRVEKLDNLSRKFEHGISVLSKTVEHLDELARRSSPDLHQQPELIKRESKSSSISLNSKIQNLVKKALNDEIQRQQRIEINQNIKDNSPTMRVNNIEGEKPDDDEFEKLELYYRRKLNRFNRIIMCNTVDSGGFEIGKDDPAMTFLASKEIEVALNSNFIKNISRHMRLELEMNRLKMQATSLLDSIRFSNRHLDWIQRNTRLYEIRN